MWKIVLVCLCIFACEVPLSASFNSRKLISSKGEKIYVNSLNWGVTDDNQMSCISKNPGKVRNIKDTVGMVRGLDPFIYLFRNDSLKLFFQNEIFYRVNEHFNTINVSYTVLTTKKYNELRWKVGEDLGYYSVPMNAEIISPTDMPKPPSN